METPGPNEYEPVAKVLGVTAKELQEATELSYEYIIKTFASVSDEADLFDRIVHLPCSEKCKIWLAYKIGITVNKYFR